EAPVITPENELFFRAFSQAVASVGRRPPAMAIMPGGTDLRYFMRKGIPALGYTVEGQERAHADNEFVYVKSIVETAKIFALLMKNLG
ncbi:MAG: M20/M25/M40 family metallo-hydrolase, partial [Victivallales bacterium]|nr:M20/M25/M40 family metallo-hydrolase [Victivallales bacterium]